MYEVFAIDLKLWEPESKKTEEGYSQD